jgi:threonine dehydrogenase-like Zn-dependent dehydrogenase
MNTMNALVFREPGRIDMETVPVPTITQDNQVLIRVKYCGICGSDVKILEGKHDWRPDTILGHELTGTVAEIGAGVTTVKPGDRISIDNNPRCGLCDFCRRGFSSQCVELKNRTLGVFQNGGYAEYTIAPEEVCFKLPDEIEDVTATQVETLGTVLNGMRVIGMQPWDRVLVLGCGPIGYLFTSLAKNVAARVAVTEIDPFRFQTAEKLGIPVFDPNRHDIEQEIMNLTEGMKADIVIDAVGTEMRNALSYVTAGGKILAFGMDSSSQPVIPAYDVTRRAVQILGTYIGQNTILPAVRILQSGKIDMKPFFTEVVPLKERHQAFKKVGLDLETMEQVPKKAMKMVFKL